MKQSIIMSISVICICIYFPRNLFKFNSLQVRSDVFVVFRSPLCLIVTVLTLQNCVTVLPRYVSLKMMLVCSLIITLITRILDSFMYTLNMGLKIALLCSLIITLITRILDTFMYRLNMSLKITFCCKLSSTFWTLSRLVIV